MRKAAKYSRAAMLPIGAAVLAVWTAGGHTALVMRVDAAQQPQRATPRPQPAAQDEGQIHVLPVRENVYMVVGAGGNITVHVPPTTPRESFEGSYNGLTGMLLVDSGSAEMVDQVLAVLHRLSNAPLKFIINTNFQADHVGGNAKLAGAAGVPILAQQNVLARMSARGAPQEGIPDSWPSDAFEKDRVLRFNDEAVEIRHQPPAHTDGDSIVFFRRSDVVSTGDIFNTDRFPMIDPEEGGSIDGVIDALNNILDVAVFGDRVEDGTLIVPGHGRLSDYADVNEYRNSVTIIRDRVRDLVGKGMTLDQVKASRPAREYEKRYSAPMWTSEMFIEAVYRDLSTKR